MNFIPSLCLSLLLAGLILPFCSEAGRYRSEAAIPVLPDLPSFPAWLDYRRELAGWASLDSDEEIEELKQSPPEVLVIHCDPLNDQCSVIYWDEDGTLYAIPFEHIDGIAYEAFIIKNLILIAPRRKCQFWLTPSVAGPSVAGHPEKKFQQFESIGERYHQSPRILFQGLRGRFGCFYMDNGRLNIAINNYDNPPYELLEQYRPDLFRQARHHKVAGKPCFMMTSDTYKYLGSRPQVRVDSREVIEATDTLHGQGRNRRADSRPQRSEPRVSPKRLRQHPYHHSCNPDIKIHTRKPNTHHRREVVQQTLYQDEIQQLVDSARKLRYQWPVKISVITATRPAVFRQSVQGMLRQLQKMDSIIRRKGLYQGSGCHEASKKLCWHVTQLLAVLADDQCQRYEECISLCEEVLSVVEQFCIEEKGVIGEIYNSVSRALTGLVQIAVQNGPVHAHYNQSLSAKLLMLYQRVRNWNLKIDHCAGFDLVYSLQGQWLKSNDQEKLSSVAGCEICLPEEQFMSQEQRMTLQLQRWQAGALRATMVFCGQQAESGRVDVLIRESKEGWGYKILQQYEHIRQKVADRLLLDSPNDEWLRGCERCIECIRLINSRQQTLYSSESRLRGAGDSRVMARCDQYNESLVHVFKVWHALIAGLAYHDSHYEDTEKNAWRWQELARNCRPVRGLDLLNQSVQEDLVRARNKKVMHQLQFYVPVKKKIDNWPSAQGAHTVVTSIWERYGAAIGSLNSQARKNLASTGVYSAIWLDLPESAVTQLERLADFGCSEHRQHYQMLVTTIAQYYNRKNDFPRVEECAELGMSLFGECDDLLGWKARGLNKRNRANECLAWGHTVSCHRSCPALLCEMGIAAFELNDIELGYELMKRVGECKPEDQMVAATADYYLAKFYYDLSCNSFNQIINPDRWRYMNREHLLSKAEGYCCRAAAHSSLANSAEKLLKMIESAQR